MTRALVWLVVASSLTACVESSGRKRGEAHGKLASYVTESPPEVAHRLDYMFDGKIRLFGYRLDPEGPVLPGQSVKLTLYWQAMERIEPGFLLFTHLGNARGVRYASGNFDNIGPLRELTNGMQALPPGDWIRGKVYVDEQPLIIPAEADGEVQITTGIWRGDVRKPITTGAGDPESRALVAKLKVGAASDAVPAKAKDTRPDLPILRVDKLPREVPPPKIDGKLDDEAWKRAARTAAFVDVATGRPNTSFPVDATARVTWDDKKVFFAFEVTDKKLLGGLTPAEVKMVDPHVWEKECVEIMIDPDGDGDNLDYYEIQVSTQNAAFDSQFDGYNLPRGGSNGPFGHEEWSSMRESAVSVSGTLDKDDDDDQGYTVELAIPWTSLSKAQALPPRDGDVWRMNLYAMKRNGGVSWSPILGEGNFHRASRFGRVAWTSLLPAAAPSASASVKSAPFPPPTGR